MFWLKSERGAIRGQRARHVEAARDAEVDVRVRPRRLERNRFKIRGLGARIRTEPFALQIAQVEPRALVLWIEHERDFKVGLGLLRVAGD